jgi:oligoribonuclease
MRQEIPGTNKMRYVSIDIQTTGLNHKICDILQFAAVIDDIENPIPTDDLPKLVVYFLKDSYTGTPYALSMHSEIFKKIDKAQREEIEENELGEKFMDIQELPDVFHNFLSKNGFKTDSKNRIHITVAGKNVSSFDVPFLNNKIKDWNGVVMRHRAIDPAILYYKLGDDSLPDTKLCMARAGLSGEVAHTALEDAIVVVKLIRRKLCNNGCQW